MTTHSLGNFAAARATDNRPGSAIKVGTLNGQKKFRGSVGITDKVDFYSFTISGRSSFNLALNKLKNNVDVSLLQGGITLFRSAKGGKKPEAIAATLEAGTYFIRVNQKSGNSKYKLTLNASSLTGGTDPGIPQPLPTPSRKLVSLLTSGSSVESRLGFIDLSSGAVSTLPIGNMAGTVLNDIATFGNDTFAVANPNNLYRIDPATSTYTLVSNLVAISTTTITSLGYTSSGALYAAASGGEFYSIDTATGKANLVAKIPGFAASGDLAYDATSNRFFATSQDRTNGGADSLYSIGLTGDATLIGNVGFTQVWGLALENGTLYGFTPREQIKINLTTGAGTLDKPVSPINTAISGSA
jgi:Bacterial pre-peptidase C-terminal domain